MPIEIQWQNKLWLIRSTEYETVVKINESKLCRETWVNLQTGISEKASQRIHILRFCYTEFKDIINNITFRDTWKPYWKQGNDEHKNQSLDYLWLRKRRWNKDGPSQILIVYFLRKVVDTWSHLHGT